MGTYVVRVIIRQDADSEAEAREIVEIILGAASTPEFVSHAPHLSSEAWLIESAGQVQEGTEALPGTQECDECAAVVPAGATVHRYHDESCSLHPDNVRP